MRQLSLLLATVCFCLLTTLHAQADPLIVSLPLATSASVSLTQNPVLTIGSRTIDFTPNLNQQFIAFLPVVSPAGGGNYHVTIGLRARDGLGSLSGNFAPSPDPTFVNQLPLFSFGTTDLLLFDFVTAGSAPFTITLTDLKGIVVTAQLAAPVPEPATIFLLSMGLAGIGAMRRKRQAMNSGDSA